MCSTAHRDRSAAVEEEASFAVISNDKRQKFRQKDGMMSDKRSEYADRVETILSSKYRSYAPLEQLRPVRREGSFDGVFRGKKVSWLVAPLAYDESLFTIGSRIFQRLDNKADDEEDYSGILLVITPGDNGDNDFNETHLEQVKYDLNQRNPKNRIVEIITLDELEMMSDFDDLTGEYPGRIVTIGHNSDLYHETLAAIDAVTGALRSSNSHGLTAEVRYRLLVEVQAGRTLLEATTVRVKGLAQTIVPALKFIATTCANAALGELAKQAVIQLAKLIFG